MTNISQTFMSHLLEFLKHRSVGTVVPSSAFLGKKMYGNIDFSKAEVVVEFGPGCGAFTKDILAKINPNCTLILFETNTVFYNKLTTSIKDKRVIILNKNAEQIGDLLAVENVGKADYIFSSIPLALIPKGVKRSILQNAVSNLKPNGKYIQFQYSLADYKLLKKHFSRVRLKFTMLNFPPAFVYSCSV